MNYYPQMVTVPDDFEKFKPYCGAINQMKSIRLNNFFSELNQKFEKVQVVVFPPLFELRTQRNGKTFKSLIRIRKMVKMLSSKRQFDHFKEKIYQSLR